MVGVGYRPRSGTVFFTRNGKKLEDVLGDEEWQAAEKGFTQLDKFFAANGPALDELVMGDQVSFADIQIASTLMWVKRSLGENSEEWKRVSGWNGGKWKRIVNRLSPYEVIDL